MAGERWIFTKPQLLETPSRKCGVDIDKELSYRQQAANLIQEMGQRLQTNQLCINTAIVYMHRFYMFHSFTKFNRNVMSPACIFLAAKVEEQPRKLEHVIKTAHSCLREGSLDTKSETYLEYAQELIINENILLQTLGFEVRVDHPHTTVVTTCQLVRASKDLAQTSYFLATNSLHLTTMCLQQKPNVVACVCIHLACKWSGYEIPSSHEGKLWFNYVDKNITIDLLEELTQDFLNILDKCPSRLKKKIMTWRSGKNGDESMKGETGQSTSKGGDSSSSKPKSESAHARNIFEDSSAIINDVKPNSERSQHPTNTAGSSGSARPSDGKSHSGHPPMNIKDYKQHKEYKERKEKERMTGHSSHGSVKPHGNGDVKRSHHHQGRVDPERKATQHAFDSLHHMSRDDSKRHEVKREHDSPIKMTIKSEKSRSHELSSKAVKRSHQSDNELSDGSERHSKHRRSETHPISNDNFPAGSINHTDMFTGKNYPPSSIKVETGNGNSGSERHSKNRTGYSEGGGNSDRAMWNSGKSSTKSPGSSSVKSSNSSRKDRSIFSPPQHLSHHPPPPPHMLQNKMGLTQSGPPPPPHVISKGNMNASFDQAYQRSHPPNYGHAQYPNPNMMGSAYPDGQHSAVQGMNSNGGTLPGSNQQEMIGDIQSQLQNIIARQKYQIAQQQAQNHPQQSSIFDIDLLDSDLGTMPPLPPPLPQNNAPQPPPPPY